MDYVNPVKTKPSDSEMKINYKTLTIWITCMIASIIGWVIILYSVSQLYFYLNPSPPYFRVFLFFQPTTPDMEPNDQLRGDYYDND